MARLPFPRLELDPTVMPANAFVYLDRSPAVLVEDSLAQVLQTWCGDSLGVHRVSTAFGDRRASGWSLVWCRWQLPVEVGDVAPIERVPGVLEFEELADDPAKVVAEASAPCIGWSPWFEADSSWTAWRWLLVRRRVFSALLEACVGTDVFVHGEAMGWEPSASTAVPEVERAIPSPEEEASSFFDRKGITTGRVLHRIRAEAVASGHVFAPPKNRAAVVDWCLGLGWSASHLLVEFMSEMNGASLFDGSLGITHARSAGKAAARFQKFDLADFDREQRARLGTGGVYVPGGWYTFARSHGGEVYWVINAAGHVRGIAREGDGSVVGRLLPSAVWLVCMLDVGRAARIRRSEGWARRWLAE